VLTRPIPAPAPPPRSAGPAGRQLCLVSLEQWVDGLSRIHKRRAYLDTILHNYQLTLKRLVQTMGHQVSLSAARLPTGRARPAAAQPGYPARPAAAGPRPRATCLPRYARPAALRRSPHLATRPRSRSQTPPYQVHAVNMSLPRQLLNDLSPRALLMLTVELVPYPLLQPRRWSEEIIWAITQVSAT
jgi:hypothetical protein